MKDERLAGEAHREAKPCDGRPRPLTGRDIRPEGLRVPGSLRRVAIVWVATLGYAVSRYVVLGPVPVEGVPLYVLNKTLAFTALTLFALTYLPGTGAHHARTYGICGTWLIFAHVLLSLLLFSLRAFESFQSPSGQLYLHVQLAMLLGVVGVLVLAWQHLHPKDAVAKIARTTVVAAAVAHVALIGFRGWFTPERWHGGLPPMTLLAALLGLAALSRAAWLWNRRQKPDPRAMR